MPSPKTNPASTETTQARGLSTREGEKFTGCWLTMIVRRSKAIDAKARSINQKLPRRIRTVSTKKIANSASFNLNMYQ